MFCVLLAMCGGGKSHVLEPGRRHRGKREERREERTRFTGLAYTAPFTHPNKPANGLIKCRYQGIFRGKSSNYTGIKMCGCNLKTPTARIHSWAPVAFEDLPISRPKVSIIGKGKFLRLSDDFKAAFTVIRETSLSFDSTCFVNLVNVDSHYVLEIFFLQGFH